MFDDCLSSPPESRKAVIRRVLDELFALGLLEVGTDEHGAQRYRPRGVCHFLVDVAWPQ
jgi:hypothetical protein